MIADHTIISARAEKSQMVPAQRLVRRILAASMAALLMLPSLAAWGTDRLPGKPGSADAFEEKAPADSPSRVDAMDDVECGREHPEGRYADAATNAALARAGATRVHGIVVQLLTA